MTRRNIIAAVLALVVAGVCVRLGIWQLDRLAERRAQNAEVAARSGQPPVPLSDLPPDTLLAPFRRVRVSGTFDYDREIVLTGKTRNGAPGVHILTPLRLDGSERAVWVNRGWVYAPDAASVDLARWQEPVDTHIEGYVMHYTTSGRGSPRSATDPRAWRWPHGPELARAVPYPIQPFYLVALPEKAAQGTVPVRLPLPEQHDGPHLGYAFQWFAFATIAVVGVAALLWQDRKTRRMKQLVVTDTAARTSS